MRKKIFITLEGLDGCGKSTQALFLRDYFEKKGLKVYLTREPGGSEVGDRIRELLLSTSLILNSWTEAFLYIASRVENSQIIRQKLEEDFIVICERYIDSTIAYQGYGRGLPLDVLENLNRIATLGLSPTVTFLFDIDPRIALSRKKTFDRIEKEDMYFYTRVREGYLAIAKKEKDRIVVLSGELSEMEIFNHIVSYVEKLI